MEDDTCQSHKFFYALHESHARYNVVMLEVMHMEPESIMTRWDEYFIQLFDSYTNIDDNVIHDRNLFLSGARSNISKERVKSSRNNQQLEPNHETAA